MASDGLNRILQHLKSHETLYTSAVVSLAINQTQEDVQKATRRKELACVVAVARPNPSKDRRFYEAEAVACYLDKPVSEVRHYLNMARLVVLAKDKGGVADYQRTADDYHRSREEGRSLHNR